VDESRLARETVTIWTFKETIVDAFTMQLSVQTKQSFDTALKALHAAVEKHKFGVLHTFDLKSTLHSKGVSLNKKCQIFEVCNPQLAGRVLNINISFSPVLPCRIAVYEEDDGVVKFSYLRPLELFLHAFSENTKGLEEVRGIAVEVEKTMKDIVMDAAETS